MSVQLIALNSLKKSTHGIWVSPDADNDFGYSDGSNEEQYLVDLFKSSRDLSLGSQELAAAIQDWASLYHLSTKRANLLRNINLATDAKILELGCGCGAITRYLAEQAYQVTAVEGSLKRAEIARLRNRDMSNAEIICHNFNTLNLPAEHYDAVLFIGVLEYAKRFSGQTEISPEQAVIQLLNKAKNTLKPQGLILIAIENRTGLKYELGALEDHLAIAGAGLNNYKGYESTGIKTYDYTQWQEIFAESGLANTVYFPFPDYKLPDMVICGNIDQQDAEYLSSQIHSNDPISNWTMPQSEQQQWLDILLQAKLPEKTNSFGFIATKTELSTNKIFNNNWCLYDSSEIKPELNLSLNSNEKEKINKINLLRRIFNKPSEVKKSLLDHWLEAFSQSPNQETLTLLAKAFLSDYQHAWPSKKLLDLNQVMSVPQKTALQYAKYWQPQTDVTVEQQLFHLLLDFCFNYKKFLAKASDLHLHSIKQIIINVFNELDLDLEQFESSLIRFEQEFMDCSQISNRRIEHDLKTLISSFDQHGFAYVNSQLFFSKHPNQFTQDASKSILTKQTGSLVQLSFNELESDCTNLRFDPCDHLHGDQHFVFLDSIDILDNNSHSTTRINLADNLNIQDMEQTSPEKQIFKVKGIDPQIIFSLPDNLKKTSSSYNLTVGIQWLGK